MALEQALVFGIILLTLGMLAFEVWRYDVVALIGMLLLVISEFITIEEAFGGFAHGAVVTIAAVLVVSRGLQNTGVADLFVKWMGIAGNRLAPQLIVLCGLVIVSSAFMNNIAALAIFIPVAIRIARKTGHPSSLYLLPMAFSSHFGGLITLIGTPTNLIVSGLRVEQNNPPFGMFAFAPVGLAISVVGVTFIALVGWHLIPRRENETSDESKLGLADYIAEVEIPAESSLAGKRLRDLKSICDADVWVVTIERDSEVISSPEGSERVESGDVLLVRAEARQLRQCLHDTQGRLRDSKPIDEENGEATDHANVWESLKARLESEEIETVEVIVAPDSTTIDHTARDLRLRTRHEVNLLAISRRDEHLRSSVGSTSLEAGDILLVQAQSEDVSETCQTLGWLPIKREIHLQPRNTAVGVTIFAGALVTASLDLLPVPIAMLAAAVAMVISGLVSVREAYEEVEWPIVILLGAMLSMGVALENTGGDQLIADQILRASGVLSPTLLLVIILLATMILSDIVNNAAAVVLMASIAVSVAEGLGVSTDPFLVAVAIGGACAFLTPIGHEANVLVFEAGGYQFGDYWRLGLPLELLITAVAVPMLLWIWPL